MDQTLLSEDLRFGRLFEAYSRPLYAYCLRRLDGQDAADAVASVFTIAWRRLDDIPSEPMELPWLYGVARRVVSEHHRSERRRKKLTEKLSQIGIHVDPEPDVIVLERADYQLVRRALAFLSHSDREILMLAAWEELSNAEIAVAIGCSTQAAAQRLHRARRRLGQQFQRVQEMPKRSGRTGGEVP